MKKNILHITASTGGVEHYINSIISKSKMFQHHLVITDTYNYTKKDLDKSFICYISESNKFNILRDIFNIIKIIVQIKKQKKVFHLIHAHSSKGTLYGCFVSCYFKLPILVSAHAFGFLKFKGIAIG